MTKTKEWLKNEVNELPLRFLGFSMLKQREEFAVSKDDVLELINQLDEPEVLSSDWIKDNQLMWTSIHGAEYYVPANKLYGKIVPKQEEITESFKETVRKLVETSELAMDVRKLTGMTLEEIKEEARNGGFVPKQELPVIPNYVAKWISEHHERFDLYPALKRLENNALSWEDVYEWYRKNTRKFVNAYLTGKYEVEVGEEQKYYVILEENSYGAMGLGIGREGRLTFTATHDKWSLPKLTEQEIKDYDERYWHFAVKVKELEE